MNAYTDADVAALTSVTCRKHHGLGAPERPCYGCRSDAARLLDAVAKGIAARTLRDAAAEKWLDPIARVRFNRRADEIERAS